MLSSKPNKSNDRQETLSGKDRASNCGIVVFIAQSNQTNDGFDLTKAYSRMC